MSNTKIKGYLHLIYALEYELEPGVVRYIGKTLHPEKRIVQHKKDKSKTHRGNWLRQINYRFKLIELEWVKDHEWQDREKHWIQYYKNLGFDLTNSTQGGDGITGYKMTEDHKFKIGISNKGNNYGKGNKGKVRTPETKDKIRKANIGKLIGNTLALGRKMSEEEKAKRASTRPAWTDERRESARQRMLGNKIGVGNKNRSGCEI